MLAGVRHKSVLKHPHLKVNYNQAPCRERSLLIIDGISAEERSLKINDPNIDTLSCALLERMYYCKVGNDYLAPPVPSRTHIDATLTEFTKRLKKQLPISTRISPEQFVEMYTGRKKTIYSNALPEFYERGVLEEHARSVAFVKCEKVPAEKAPRCIQPRHPVYNVGVGSYLKPIEHSVYRAIARVFGSRVTVVKGFNVEQVAQIVEEKWHGFADPIAVGLDATKFDMHVSKSMLEWEHSIYLYMFRHDRELARLLKYQVFNKGAGYCDDGKLKYKVKGRRFSGDMNTALGNCLIMCAMIYCYAKSRGVKIDLMNNGDDCQVFMEKKDLAKFMLGLDDWFLQLGFRMTSETPASHISEVEFCQMRYIRRQIGGSTMVRNIPKAREKDSMSLIPHTTAKSYQKWLYSVGECGISLCAGIPIMQSMYQCYMRNGLKGSKMRSSVQFDSGMERLAKGLHPKHLTVSDEARVDCFIAWDITPDEQREIESYYDSLILEFKCERREDLSDVQCFSL